MPDKALILTSVAGRCVVYPLLGGSLGSWSVEGQDMLHAASADDVAAHDPLRISSFPLVPYSNRIGNARFDWASNWVQLAPNFAPEPHAIHGAGWKRAWEVISQGAGEITLGYRHLADANWPWAFTAEQTMSLTETALTLTLRTRNDHGAPVPLAFGHHPYFDAAGAYLKFSAQGVWMSGADALPTEIAVPTGDFDFLSGAAVDGRAVDHCYTGWAGSTRINWAGRRYALELTASPTLPAAVIYIPKGGDAFCFEPVPHINNALNLPGHEPAMPVIAPGAWFEAKILMRAVTA